MDNYFRRSPLEPSIASPPAKTPPPHQAANPTANNSSQLKHNFIVLTVYQVILRIGWIFKTESVVMPAVLDSIGGTATLRGLLPMLSRFAMAVPRVMATPTIRRMEQKKNGLAFLSTLMGISFLVLASCWLIPRERLGDWFPYLFLVIYTVFFVCSGLNLLCFGTLQGKIIPATLRGRLMLSANVIGALFAVTAVLILLPRWLQDDGGSFQYIFGFAGVSFTIAGLAARFVDEPVDVAVSKVEAKSTDGFPRVWAALCEDGDLRRIALVATLGGCYIMLFPHFQALARERMDASYRSLIVWVAVQNVGTALFSSIAGWVADVVGNRRVLQVITGCLTFIPFFALVVSRSDASPIAFSAVFFFVGLTPVFLRIVGHYTLELTEPDNHPRYLAAIALCTAVPFLLSGVVGYAVDQVGFEKVFMAISVVIAMAFVLTFRMVEPRHTG